MEPLKKKYSVFISYSHEDAAFVSPIVKILSINREDLVFQDFKDIRPGSKWRDMIDEALFQSEILVLFWCSHALKSVEIEREYLYALENSKSLIPVLLDETALVEKLKEFQWIDLRLLNLHEQISKSGNWVIIDPKGETAAVKPMKKASKVSWSGTILMAAIISIAIIASIIWGIVIVLIGVAIIIVGVFIAVAVSVIFGNSKLTKKKKKKPAKKHGNRKWQDLHKTEKDNEIMFNRTFESLAASKIIERINQRLPRQ